MDNLNNSNADKKLVEIKDLSISFFTPAGEVKAVRGVSWSLREGEALGIVGESGSGKSVSVYALMGILQNPGKVIGGSITFNNIDMLKLKESQWRLIRGKDMSMIFQDPMTSLNPVYTVGNQIAETVLAHTRTTAQKANKEAVKSLARVHIPNPERRARQYPFEFSGGMRQRAMISMALSCEPKLLIADEPTTALDVTIQAQIIELLKELKKNTNMGIILITHDMGIITDICEDVIIMYGGQVMESASVKELYKNPAHPYTLGLLECLPRLSSDSDEPLKPIEGSPVDLLNPPKGCPFAPRCFKCMKICLNNQPPNFEIKPGHHSACWLHQYQSGRD
ncbi:MAG: Oligopeptide transport ATP-binding protein OppD [Actinobacteria bacterium ADurb.Bin346]|nr:MAG: Oligopeptide transport ATP-binding protein OppD [Actinobacteria bacterium ADurb.Bin346]